jgi:hypothetical protein
MDPTRFDRLSIRFATRHTRRQAIATGVSSNGYRRRRGASPTAGYDIVDFENVFRLAYIRGPEGLIVEVAQPLGSA